MKEKKTQQIQNLPFSAFNKFLITLKRILN